MAQVSGSCWALGLPGVLLIWGERPEGFLAAGKGIRGPVAAATARAQKWPSSLPLTLPSPSQGRSKAGEHALEKDEPMNRGMAGAWAPPCALGHKEFTLLVASRCFSSPPSAKIHSPLSPPHSPVVIEVGTPGSHNHISPDPEQNLLGQMLQGATLWEMPLDEY